MFYQTQRFMQKSNRFISNCKMRFRYLDEYDRILNLPEIKKEMSRFKDIMSKLTELTGKNIEKLWTYTICIILS